MPKFGSLLHGPIITDDTNLVIRDISGRTIAAGKWYEDNVLKQMHKPVREVKWGESGCVYIGLTAECVKEEDGHFA